MEKSTLSPPPINRMISPSAERHYTRIVQTLQRHAKTKNEFGYEVDASPVDLVKYLFSERGSYRPRTFLGYRTALLWWLAKLPINEEVKKAWELLHSPLPTSGYKGVKEEQDASIYSKRSMRKRSVPKRTLNKLLDELAAKAKKGRTIVERNRATELRFWIRAGLATGLRPTEWQQAFWKNKSKGELYVINAKRKLDNYALPNINHLSDDKLEQMRTVIVEGKDIHWVDAHLKSVQAHLAQKKPFDSYYLNNRMYLQNICKRIFKNPKDRITLYQLRGQFAANRKKDGKPFEDISKEMGCSPYHLSRSYGNKSYGYALTSSSRTNAPKQKEKEKVSDKPTMRAKRSD